MNNLFDINGKVVVMTGGSGVLGSAIMRHLASQGAKVVILARNEAKGTALAEEIRGEGGDAMFLATDVMDIRQLEANREAILARYGRVDALLNAAGGNRPGATIPPSSTFFDLDPQAFADVMNLNLIGTVLPTQVFLKPIIATACMGFTARGAYQFFSAHLGNSLSTIGAIACAGLVYAALVLLLRIITAEDLEMLPHGDRIAKWLRVKR